jgi:predicted metal-dependent phosphotriesterase family hydrolase
MSCFKHDQEAHYHFTLCDIVDYVKQHGVDRVMIDIYEMLAENCNREVKQLEISYEE